MSLAILFADEMKGFYKSKVMLALWVGMPIIVILMRFLQAEAEAEGISITLITAFVISVMGSVLAAEMLSTTIVSEKNQHVFDLFLVRPVTRGNILVAKYLAVLTCLIVATAVSIGFGVAIDAVTLETPLATLWEPTGESLVVSVSTMAISCAVGVLLGVVAKSVASSAILAIYCGGQMSAVLMLPTLYLPEVDPVLYSAPVGCIVSCVVLAIAIVLFNRKQF